MKRPQWLEPCKTCRVSDGSQRKAGSADVKTKGRQIMGDAAFFLTYEKYSSGMQTTPRDPISSQ